MDKKTKIFFAIFFLLIAGSVALTYYRIMVKKDYIVENQIDCDPAAETCFIWECDPESDVEGEACTGDPEADIWYYKIAYRNAGMIPLCDPNVDETCDPWTCQERETDCGETLCDESNKEELGAECSDPEEYLANNPPEEEAVECEEGDEECLAAEEELPEEAECAEGEECASEETEEPGAACDAENGDCPASEAAPVMDEGVPATADMPGQILPE